MKKRFLAFLVLTFSLISFSLSASMVFSTDLKQLANQADLVFKGVCKEKHKESLFFPKLGKEVPVFVYTFETQEVIKGNVSSSFEFKQVAIRSRREAAQLGFGMVPTDGAPLEVGKSYLLFLSSPSQLGLRFVIGGAGQGMFEVLKDSEGKEKVVNLSGNRGLFQGVPKKSLSKAELTVVQAPPGPVPYDEFASIIRKALGN